MSVESLLQKLSQGQAYAQKALLTATMIAIVEEYQSGAASKDVYSHAMVLLGCCYKHKLNDLYTIRLRSNSIKSEVVSEKRKFSVPLQPTPKFNSYDRRNKYRDIPTRPMILSELYKEMDYQLSWFAQNQPQRDLGIQTNLESFENLKEQLPDNLTNGELLTILKTITSFMLEAIGSKPEDYAELGQFLEQDLSYEQKCQDDIRETDFKNPKAVERQLSSGIFAYKKYQEKQQCRDDQSAAESLRVSSQCAYGCYENALKYYLYRWTALLVEEGKKDPAELAAVVALKDSWGEKLDIVKVMNRFNALHSIVTNDPQIQAPTISVDWDLLRKGWDKNNEVKHRGAVPSAKELEAQIKEIIRFVRIAVPSGDILPDINRFMVDEQPQKIRELEIAPVNPEWEELCNLCGNFDGNSYHYVLVVPSELSPDDFGKVFGMSWDMIIDMDPASEEKGLMGIFQRTFGKQITARTPGKHMDEFLPIAAPYWIRGNGIADDASSVCNGCRRWNMRYGQHFKDLFVKFHGRYTRPVKIIYLPGMDPDFQIHIMESVVEAFSDAEGVDTYGVEQILMDNHDLIEEFDVTSFHPTSIGLDQFLAGIASLNCVSFQHQNQGFPGMKINQQLDNTLELEEFCEPVYLSLGKESSDQGAQIREFYRGVRKISWRELALRKDLPRDDYQNQILPNLKRLIAESETPFFTIGYKPGYGGTTLLRRIAWDLHTEYPTLIVNRYFPSCVERLQALRSQIENVGRLVLLIDSNDMSFTDADYLFRDLRVNTIPAAIIYLKRRERASSGETFVLDSLNQNEIQQMIDRLISAGVDSVCGTKLERMRTQPPRNETERTPFCLAMYAFDKDFVGFSNYVHNFLKEPMQEIYREFLVYIALHNRISFGPALDVEFFAYHMDGVATGNDAMQKLCQRDVFSNLVVFQKENKLTTCKMRYPGIAEEVLIQMTNRIEGAQTVNYQELSNYIRKFIRATCIRGYNTNLEDFLKRLLIDRDSGHQEGRDSFARMILDIIGREGKYGNGRTVESGTESAELVLKTLSDCYPDNPHFSGHYGRFLSERKGNYEEALVVLDRAISMCRDGSDCTLLHMKGTIYYRLVEKSISDIHSVKKRGADPEQEIRMLHLLVDRAHELFERVRSYGSFGVTGMLSNIKLCISVIEMGKKLESVDTEIFFQNHINDWYRDLLDRANNLFEECEQYADDMSPEDSYSYRGIQDNIRLINKSSRECISFFEKKITDTALIDRTLLRRHLARIYDDQARREDGEYDNPQKTSAYQRIMELMEDNIKEDPQNTANYRQWFRAALNSKCGDEELVHEALIKVNQWLDVDEQDCQAQLYRYMLTFLRAYDSDTAAESRLKEYRQALQRASGHITRNTDTKFILTHGSGLQRLSARLFNMTDADEARKNLLPVTGRLERKKNRSEATIRSYGIEVFFNPLHSNGTIRDEHFASKALVTYGVLFSFDGPRAYDASVELQSNKQRGLPLSAGKTVKCSVLQRVNDFLVLSIHGHPDKAKLYISDLGEPYSEANVPAVMTDLDVVLKYPTEINYRTETAWGWRVVMDDGSGGTSDMDKPLATNAKLREYLEKISE